MVNLSTVLSPMVGIFSTAMYKANFHDPLAIMQPHMYWTDA